jgi:beta-N-acetylhexosaminidase
MMHATRIILAIALCNTLALHAESWAHRTLQSMTLDQKIGQLFMVAAISDEQMNTQFMHKSAYTMDKNSVEHFIQHYHVGGIIFLGTGTPEKQIERTNHFQRLSTIPLLIGQDLEWGLSMRLQNTMQFPRNGALSTLDNNLIYELGYEIGTQARSIGVHINFAPVADVNNNPNNPVINTRSFGEKPENVANKCIAYMQGLHAAGVLACAKHFPGHGDTTTDSHYDLPQIPHTRERLNAIELYPFKKLIEAGVPTIMIAHLEMPSLESMPHLPASLSATIINGLLKHELGFTGLVITDALGMEGVSKHHQPGDIELKALMAGNDILLCPVDMPHAHAAIKEAVANKIISESDLDAHVLKILQAKEWAKLHNHPQDNYVYQPEILHSQRGYNLQKKIIEKISAQ